MRQQYEDLVCCLNILQHPGSANADEKLGVCFDSRYVISNIWSECHLTPSEAPNGVPRRYNNVTVVDFNDSHPLVSVNLLGESDRFEVSPISRI
jgi:hypothetical protein